mmetsp:Transcript_43720/g.94890  ORF Transcript_43720/g.94890 Transcript_43720/m.94890 type:complete len:133 (-) Transcript_43720:77-475(-)
MPCLLTLISSQASWQTPPWQYAGGIVALLRLVRRGVAGLGVDVNRLWPTQDVSARLPKICNYAGMQQPAKGQWFGCENPMFRIHCVRRGPQSRPKFTDEWGVVWTYVGATWVEHDVPEDVTDMSARIRWGGN